MGLTKSAAATLIAGLVKRVGASAMARKLELTEGAVRSHAEGRAVPRRKAQERYRDVYQVPVESWPTSGGYAPVEGSPAAKRRRARPTEGVVAEEAPALAAPPAPPVEHAPIPLPDAPTETTDALQMVLRLLATAQQELEGARGDRDVPYNTRASLITSATRLCQLLARLSGQLEVSHAAILRSAAWTRILRVFESVLVRHPEAQSAFAEVGRELAGLGE